MQRSSDPLGVMIVRVHAALCWGCDCPAAEHRDGPCTCGKCEGWVFGGFGFVPDRPVPDELRRALHV